MKLYDLKRINTPRLLIRPVSHGDEVPLNAAVNRSLSTLQRWMPWSQDPSLEATSRFVQSGEAQWSSREGRHFPMVVVHKADNQIIGASGYNEKSDFNVPYCEIGYWIDDQYQGQGLVTEYVNALTRYAFDVLKVQRVQIATQVDNNKSVSVAVRCGYTLEARLKHYCIDCESGSPADSYLFACYDTSVLPPLDVTWQHESNQND